MKDEQQRKLAATDLRTTYLVEAAAGTGKTTLLVERILNAIKAGTRLTEMVAITFTEKAAGELKGKLRKKLTGDALADLERAQVSTIHSFCSWLLKERPVEAGIDPQFAVADELQSELLLEETWNEWLPAEAVADKIDSNPLRRLLAAGLGIDKLWALAQLFVREREKLALPRLGRRQRIVPAVLDDIRGRVERLAALRQSCSSPKPDKLALAIDEWIDVAGQFKELETWEAEVLALSAPAFEDFGDRRKWKPENHFTEARQLGAEVEQFRLELMDGLLRETMVWMREFLQRYDQRKRERVWLDFDDLLRLTRDLLRDNRPVRAELQRRFRHIFVDEFQDTDPLQTEIVFLLAEDGARATRWQDCRLAPGKLFLVGDPKQSIYAFRRADIELYQSVAEKLDVLNIQTNFRSQPAILKWVNDVFREIIKPPDDGAYQPRYVELEPSKPDSGPAVWQLLPTEELESKRDARPLEADAVARCLRHLHEKHEWRDMVLLFCTTTALETFTDALCRYEVPYRVIGGKDFYVRQEVLTLASLLCCLDNPADKLNLVAVLRSPIFGWTDEQIFQAELDYLHGENDAFRLLRELHTHRHDLSVAAFTEAAMNATKICEVFFAKPDGEQSVMNLLKALELARALEAAGERSVRAVVRRLRRSVLEGWDEESSPATEEGDDVVRLMTVHKAKGLEFPIVVMADLTGESQDRGAAVLSAEHIEARIGRLKTAGFDAAREHQSRRAAAEQVRLLYVAATRAKTLLVVPWFVPEARPGRSKLLAKALESVKMTVRTAKDFPVKSTDAPPLRVKLLTDAPDDGRIRERHAWLSEHEALLERASQPRMRVSPSKLAHEVEPREPVGDGRERAMEFGVIVHDALERMDTTGLSDEARRMVERALKSDLLARAGKADELYRELPFSTATMDGKIDLLFREGQRWTLVDYKTDAQPDAERYQEQLRAYAGALKQVAGIEVAESVLYFLATGELVSL